MLVICCRRCLLLLSDQRNSFSSKTSYI